MLGTQAILDVSWFPPFVLNACHSWQRTDAKGAVLGLVNPFSTSSPHCRLEAAPRLAACPFSRLSSNSSLFQQPYPDPPCLTLFTVWHWHPTTLCSHWHMRVLPLDQIVCSLKAEMLYNYVQPPVSRQVPSRLVAWLCVQSGAELALSQDGATFPGKCHLGNPACRPGCGERGTFSTSFLLHPRVYTPCASFLAKSLREAREPRWAFLRAGGTTPQRDFLSFLNQTKYCYSKYEIFPSFHRRCPGLTKLAITHLESK